MESSYADHASCLVRVKTDLGDERAHERLTLFRRALGDHTREVAELVEDDGHKAVHVGRTPLYAREVFEAQFGGLTLAA